MNLLDTYTNAIITLCAKHKVKKLSAFGSVLRNDFSSKSDIDLLVNFQDITLESYADNYFNFKFSLEDLLQRPVDLIEEDALKNPYFKNSVRKSCQLIYEN